MLRGDGTDNNVSGIAAITGILLETVHDDNAAAYCPVQVYEWSATHSKKKSNNNNYYYYSMFQ